MVWAARLPASHADSILKISAFVRVYAVACFKFIKFSSSVEGLRLRGPTLLLNFGSYVTIIKYKFLTISHFLIVFVCH